jgi:hypothetical protein
MAKYEHIRSVFSAFTSGPTSVLAVGCCSFCVLPCILVARNEHVRLVSSVFFPSPLRPERPRVPPSSPPTGHRVLTHGAQAAGTRTRQPTSIQRRGQERVEPHLHFPNRRQRRGAQSNTGQILMAWYSVKQRHNPNLYPYHKCAAFTSRKTTTMAAQSDRVHVFCDTVR